MTEDRSRAEARAPRDSDQPIAIAAYDPLWVVRFEEERVARLHLVPLGSARFREELAFRDHLRAHPDVAADYATLKRRLAARFEHDREAGTEAKGRVHRAMLERSEASAPARRG